MHLGWKIILTALAVLPISSSCSTTSVRHEYEISPGREFNPSIQTALVLPLNETMEAESGLASGADATADLIVRYLESKGLKVEQPEMRDYRKAIDIAANEAQKVRDSGGADSVSETLAFTEIIPHLKTALDSDADIIVTPNMMLRYAVYNGRKALLWDGVRRQERGTSNLNMTGNIQAASLNVVIYDDQGTRIFSGYGGLDLLFEINVTKRRYELRENRLQNVKNLAEGVCVSFHPFFGLTEPCYSVRNQLLVDLE